MDDTKPGIKVGDIIVYAGGTAIVRMIYDEPDENGAVLSAIIDPVQPVAYDFARIDNKWCLVDEGGGGSYVRPGHPDWHLAVQLRVRAGIKNPQKY